MRPRWTFRPGGKCGTRVSDIFPHLRDRMDDICLINSMTTDNNEHFQATLAIHTGSYFQARPSMGSWLSYGLGTFNQNLPSFIVIAPGLLTAGRPALRGAAAPARGLCLRRVVLGRRQGRDRVEQAMGYED